MSNQETELLERASAGEFRPKSEKSSIRLRFSTEVDTHDISLSCSLLTSIESQMLLIKLTFNDHNAFCKGLE